MGRRKLLVALLVLSVAAVAAIAAGPSGRDASAPPSGGADQFFEGRIRPLLSEQCYRCHSAAAEKLKGGMRLDSREGLLKGGEGGAIVVAGHPERSRLIEAVRYGNPDLQMPPKSRLTAQQVADLTRWVESGA